MSKVTMIAVTAVFYAVAAGLVAAGVTFPGGYPLSPSTIALGGLIGMVASNDRIR